MTGGAFLFDLISATFRYWRSTKRSGAGRGGFQNPAFAAQRDRRLGYRRLGYRCLGYVHVEFRLPGPYANFGFKSTAPASNADTKPPCDHKQKAGRRPYAADGTIITPQMGQSFGQKGNAYCPDHSYLLSVVRSKGVRTLRSFGSRHCFVRQLAVCPRISAAKFPKFRPICTAARPRR